MATYTNLPGALNIEVRRGDELGLTPDFNVSLAGYTVSAAVYSIVTGSTAGTMSAALTTDGSDGKVSLSMTEAETSALAQGTYRWALTWTAPGSVARMALTGALEVKPWA
jgi:hypothetical protein